MSEARNWPTIEAILDELLALPEESRTAALRGRTEGDPQLRGVIEALLRQTGGTDELLDRPAIEAIGGGEAVASELAAGTRVGSYRVVGLLGRGGMGEVYHAERADGAFAQRVALKLVRLGPEAGLGRFQVERRILAALEHPGIARLLDGGVTADGRPYMAMEYVDGENLLDWCNARSARLETRLRLFLQVCDAVAYAHSHLIVHRDLKPANILVTAEGQVKLLDFGIAKLLQSDSIGDATLTAHLSPAYAAPEQLTGGAITTATDVYGLGVTLYQLLCGKLPWQVTNLPLAAAVQLLLTERPAPPSAAGPAGTNKAARALLGDLDAIVSKALRLEPDGRYRDARALGADIQRHLDHLPVSARDGARAYVLRSFVRRNWLPLAAAGAVFAALVAGIGSTTWEAGIARREALRAAGEASKANAVKEFLVEIFRRSSVQSPGGLAARNVTAERIVDIGAQQIQSELGGQPEVRGELLDTLATLYDDLGVTDRAVTLAKIRLEDLQRREHPPTVSTAAAMGTLGRALVDGGHLEEGRSQLESAVRLLDTIGDHDSIIRAQTEYQLARTSGDRSAPERVAGRARLRVALAIALRRAPHGPLVGAIYREFAEMSQLDEDYSDAELWASRSLAFEQSIGTAANAFAIGNAFLELGDIQAIAEHFDAAEKNLLQGVAVLTTAAGADHPRTAMAESRLGEMYSYVGRLPEAEAMLSTALAAQLKTSQGRADSTETRKALGAVAFLRGDLGQAESVLRANLAQLKPDPAAELRYGVSTAMLVSVLAAQGRFEEAERYYAQARDIVAHDLGAESSAYAGVLQRGAFLMLAEGRPVEAADIYAKTLGAKPEGTDLPYAYTRSVLGLARADLLRGKPDDARLLCEDLLRRISNSPDADHMADQRAHALRLLGESLVRLDRAGEAEAPLRLALALRERLDGAASVWLAEARISLADALASRGLLPEARRLLAQAAAAQARQAPLADRFRAPLRAARRRLSAAPAVAS